MVRRGVLRRAAIGLAWLLALAMLGCAAQPLPATSAKRQSERSTQPRALSKADEYSHALTPPQSEPFDRLQQQFADTKAIRTFVGKATYYSNALAGHSMASGEIYDPGGAQAAHRSLPFGSIVRVTNIKGGASVVVRIADRGPFGGKGRIIDVSYAAARRIGLVRAGVLDVRVEVLRVP